MLKPFCVFLVALVSLPLAYSLNVNTNTTNFAFTNGWVETTSSDWVQGQFFGFAAQLLEPNRVVGIVEGGQYSESMSLQSIYVADNGTVILGNAAGVGPSSCEYVEPLLVCLVRTEMLISLLCVYFFFYSWAGMAFDHTQAVAVGEGGLVVVVLPDNSNYNNPLVNVHTFKFVLGDFITAPVLMQTTNIFNAAFTPMSIYFCVKYVRDDMFVMGFDSHVFNTTTHSLVYASTLQAFRVNGDGGVVAGAPQALRDSYCQDCGHVFDYTPMPIVEVADAANMTLLVSAQCEDGPTALALAQLRVDLNISILASRSFPPFMKGPGTRDITPDQRPGIAVVNQTHALARVRVWCTNSTVKMLHCHPGFLAMAAWVLIRADVEAQSLVIGEEPLFWSPLRPACNSMGQNGYEPVLQPVLKRAEHEGDTVRLFSMETISNATVIGSHLFTFVPTFIDYNPSSGHAAFAQADRAYLGTPAYDAPFPQTMYNMGQTVVALNESTVLYGIQWVNGTALTVTLQVMRHVLSPT